MTGASDRERELAQVIAEYHDRIANEEAVDADEFCRRYPHLEPELRASLATLQQIDSLSSASTEPAAQPDPGDRPETLSSHKILGRIGSGGMGTVWLAMDERLGRKVAIKTLSSRFGNDAQLRERFMQEARAMARCVSAEMHSGFSALRQNCSMELLARNPLPSLPPEVEADVRRIIALWKECRTRFGAGGPFLFSGFSAADAMYAPVCSRFRTYVPSLLAYGDDGTAAAYVETIFAMPEMAQWAEGARAEMAELG